MKLSPKLHMVEVSLKDTYCVDLYIQDADGEEGLEFAGIFHSKEAAQKAGEEILAQDELNWMAVVLASRRTNKMHLAQKKPLVFKTTYKKADEDEKKDDDEVEFVGISHRPTSSVGLLERSNEAFIEAFLCEHLVIEESQGGRFSLSVQDSESFQGKRFVANLGSRSEAVECGKMILSSPNHVDAIKSIQNQNQTSLEKPRHSSGGRKARFKRKNTNTFLEDDKPKMPRKRERKRNQFIAGHEFDCGTTSRKRSGRRRAVPSSPVSHTDVSHTEEDISTIGDTKDNDSTEWFSDLDDLDDLDGEFIRVF